MPLQTSASSFVVSAVLVAYMVVSTSLFASQQVLQPANPTNSTGSGGGGGSSTTTITFNSTQLAQFCLDACGPGGVCNQSAVTGVTSCITCGQVGYTISPLTGQCMDTSTCTQSPWCSTTEAANLATTHTAFIRIAQNLTGNASVITIPYPEGTTRTAPFIPLLGPNDASVVALLNQFLTAFQALGRGVSSTVPNFWNDQTGWWSTNLNAYRSAVPAAFAPYITTMKSKMCTTTWVARAGACMPPLS